MDPIVIKLQIEVVPAEEIDHLRLRNAKLQERYEEHDRLLEGLRTQYSELLYFFSCFKQEQRRRDLKALKSSD